MPSISAKCMGVSFGIGLPLEAALKVLTERDGTPTAEAMHWGYWRHLERRGVLGPRAPKSSGRRRS